MIEYVKYGKEKLPVKISFGALKHFQKETGKNMTNLEGDLSFEDIEVLFFHSYVSGCKAAKELGFSVKYTREEMEEILDDVYMDFITLIPKFFAAKKK